MHSWGFTEEDQAKIADEVQARACSKRIGLGFGEQTATGDAVTLASPSTSPSSRSSAWILEARDSQHGEVAAPIQDTTKGAFPWDGGSRGEDGRAGRRKESERETAVCRAVKGSSTKGRPQEREFPMVRDRDIDDMKAGRDTRRSRSRSRTREQQNTQRRGRSSSRELRWHASRRDSGWERETRYGRKRERERDKNKRFRKDRWCPHGDRSSVEWSRDHGNTRETDGASRKDRTRNPADHHAGPRTTDSTQSNESMSTAKLAKAVVKHRLKTVVAEDATLKGGFKATFGGGGGWERPEMADAADFFKDDEVSAKGGMASVAPEYEGRVAVIRAIEDEDIMCLGDNARKPLKKLDSGAEGTANADPGMLKHHNAIFAPTCSTSCTESTADSLSTCPTDGIYMQSSTSRAKSSSVVGAVARARLALAGKLGQVARNKKPAMTKPQIVEEQLPSEQDQGEQPLFKTIQVGDRVEARYIADEKWYSAIICQVIHGGFEIARYKVRYPDYGNEETISWTRIRRVESAPVQVPAASPAPTTVVAAIAEPPDSKSPDVEPSHIASVPFAGLRPRSVTTDHVQQTQRLPDQSKRAAGAAPDVINPGLLSIDPGTKLSWKEKLQAKKAGAGGAKSDADGVRGAGTKKVSLMPDYAAQRKGQVDQRLDKSEWRSKVVFGIATLKGSSRS